MTSASAAAVCGGLGRYTRVLYALAFAFWITLCKERAH